MKHRRLPSLLVLATCTAVALGAAPNAPRLIVRGDDLGSAQAANTAIIRCHRDGILTSVEVMVPTPWFPQAVQLLKENPELDVGVHLTLTSEWDTVKWRPLTAAPNLRDDEGYFLPMLWPNPNYAGRALRERPWKLEDIEREFRAQIETARRHIPRLTHLSGHMGCTDFDPQVAALTRRLAAEYGLGSDLETNGVQDLGYAGPSDTSEGKIASLIAALETLQPGQTYLFIDHPGLDTPEMRAIGHIGYEHVARDRKGVTDAWTSPRVKDAIRRLGIELVSYGDVLRTMPTRPASAAGSTPP